MKYNQTGLYVAEIDKNHNAIDQMRLILQDHEERIKKLEVKK